MTRRRLTVLVLATLALALGAIASQATPAVAGSGPNGGPLSPPTRLVIRKYGVDAPIEPASLLPTKRGFEWEIPNNAVGWHNLSSTPGHAGNTVLSGHNSTRRQPGLRKAVAAQARRSVHGVRGRPSV